MSFPVLSKEHGYLMLSTAAMCFYSALSGALYVSGARKAAFGKAWAESKEGLALQQEHKTALGESMKFSKDGYPDMGNGIYARTLPYATWYKFNLGQRAHYNLIENFPAALTLQIVAGVYFPATASALSIIWIVARHSWSRDYITGGPEARYSGIGGLHAVAVLSWFGMSVAGGLKLAGLIKF